MKNTNHTQRNNRFTYNGTTYFVGFQHNLPKENFNGSTVAYLSKIVENSEGKDVRVPILESVALCHPNDRFERKVGRLTAIRRLLENLRASGYPTEFRKMVASVEFPS